MKKSTRCVATARVAADSQQPGAVEPIDPSTAFEYIDSGNQPYPRYFNTPNQNSVGQKIADLEGGEAGLIFSSGMAAISTTLMTLLRPGDHAIFLNGLYGGSHTFVTQELEDRGVSFTFVEKQTAAFEKAIRDNTTVIYVETPTNPMMELVDLQSIAQIALNRSDTGHEITTVVDNTFASPINQNPIQLGFDVVIHSGTKYLGGHSDLCCGAVVTNSQLIERITQKAKRYGGSVNAITAYLLDRSLKTLDVRVNRQNENALQMAQWMEQHPDVSRVYYPGLENHPDYAVAKKQMSHFGAMLAFELQSNISVSNFLRNLNVVRPALSLGGVESSVCIPATTSHRDVDTEQLNSLGITEGLVRFSVGVEDIDDLKNDLQQALAASKKIPVPASVQ